VQRWHVVVLTLAGCGGATRPGPKIDTPPVDLALVSACANFVSCSQDAFYSTISRCVLINAGSDRVITYLRATDGTTHSASASCIDAANGACAAVAACVTGRVGDCTGIPSAGSVCQSTKRVFCESNQFRHEVDCRTLDCEIDGSCAGDSGPDATCLVGTSGQAECGFGSCSDPSLRSCQGDVLVTCRDGVLNHVTCGGPGLPPATCGMAADGMPGCVPRGTPCAEASERHCDGTDVVECSGGTETRYSCAVTPIPLVCGDGTYFGSLPGAPPAASSPVCVPSTQLQCDPATHPDHCDGSRIVFCDGEERTLDCAALGFRSCSATASGAVCR
jgi:hypothetical protein